MTLICKFVFKIEIVSIKLCNLRNRRHSHRKTKKVEMVHSWQGEGGEVLNRFVFLLPTHSSVLLRSLGSYNYRSSILVLYVLSCVMLCYIKLQYMLCYIKLQYMLSCVMLCYVILSYMDYLMLCYVMLY